MRRGALGALLLGLLMLAAPMAASASRIAGRIPDTSGARHLRHGVRAHSAGAAVLRYYGGPVLHSNRTHLVFWAPAGSGLNYPAGYVTLTERFLAGVAADSHLPTNVYSLSGQYSDSGGPAAYASSYAGATVATDPLPSNGCTEPSAGPAWAVCVTDAQLQQELQRTVAANHLPRGGTDIYFVVLPDGLGTCTDASSSSCALGGGSMGYCGYHSTSTGGLLYAVIPYNAVPGHCQSNNPRPNRSPADPALSSLSHEHNETVTDPDSYDAWTDPQGNEDGDLCITEFGANIGGSGDTAWNEVIGGGHYYLQEEWSNDDNSCQPRDENDRVSVAAPGRVSAGRRASFSERALDPDGAIVAYRWTFGDGAASSARRPVHAFARPGRYRLVLRVTDSAQNWTYVTRAITVVKAPSPRRVSRR